MAHRYANFWSDAAGELTAVSHTRASVIRWGVVIALTAIWIVGGLYYWRDQSPTEAIYRTIGAVGMWEQYFLHDAGRNPQTMLLEVVRFAALAAPTVGLLFAFSGQLGGSLARIFNLGAAHHIVIAGNSPAAGAIAGAETMPRARAAGLSAERHLIDSDSYHFFDRLGDAIVTGPTGNNVRDLRLLLAR